MKLEEISKGTVLRGILPDATVKVLSVDWIGNVAVELTYRTESGTLASGLVYRSQEPALSAVDQSIPWTFDSDGATYRLVSEAVRIRLAHLFDSRMAVHASKIQPLPHQIAAVYDEMLPRQPLRFLLADDPGAGKTIMAGLLIRELMARGDVERCLVVCPGSVETQWHAELMDRFGLNFEILTNEKLKTSRGNWFAENNLVLGRLHKMAWDPVCSELLQDPAAHWDLVVVDEAHKMSAKAYGNRVQYTKCYTLGMTLSACTRHLLLMTATPHNGREADFQLFMRLIDEDRFAGLYKEGRGMETDASDLMRRVVKENLLTFEGKPLFPERRATTIPYPLTAAEKGLYNDVVRYVREEYDRAEKLVAGRKNTVGFALTLLQRRLASSPAAIFQSLDGRRARLQERLDALRSEATSWNGHPVVDAERMEDAPEFERSAKEDEVLSSATAAQTAAELRAEIVSLERLTAKANAVLRSGTDTKWQQLSQLLNEQVFQHTAGPPRKLVVFTEHVATLQYLVSRIQRLFGSRKVLVKIYGSMRREARLTAQEEFHNNPDVRVLVATDAAGEGINLQCAHLMINYDLPWNPNRLEQRFGRIHRIGQTSVCQLWNLVAKDTREGSVYEALLHKLDNVSRALGGKVFDVLGTLDFGGRALRDLLIEAIRYGDRPEVQNYLKTAVEDALDAENVLRKYQEIALLEIEMDSATIRAKREEMQRARMRRLQPHYVEAFFKEAFTRIGGHMYRREARRYEVSYVPPHARGYRGRAARVASKYRRITFEHARSYLPGKVAVESISPGHPLLESVTADILHRDGDTLAKGTVLVDEADSGEQPHILFHLEHELRTAEAKSRVVSKRMLYVLAGADGSHRQLNTTPYLDWRPLKPEEPAPRHILANPLCRWISRDIEKAVEAYVTQHVVPEHMEAVQQRRDKRLDKEQRMVKKRLTHEITRWNRRSQELRLAEQEGKPAARMNSAEARRRAAEFRARLDARLDRLAAGKPVTALRPVITGAILVVPQGLLNAVAGKPGAPERAAAPDTRAFEARAREIILEIERGFGYQAKDVAHRTLGYDIESRDTDSGHLRFIRVKACAKGAENVSLTRNEVLFSLNNPEGYILGLVEFLAAGDHDVHYVWQPTNRAPDFGVSRRTYSMNFLLSKAQPPRKG